MADPTVAQVMITLALDAETPFTETLDMLVRVMNDRDDLQPFWAKTPSVNVALTFHDGPHDDYRIVVHVKGYRQAGTFVHADAAVHKTVTMLMVKDDILPRFPAWSDLKVRFPVTARLISSGVSEADAASRYVALGQAKPWSLASLMNLCTAMGDIGVGGGKTPMDYIKEVTWDDTLAQDRFFGFADPGLIPLVRAAAAEGEFAEEHDPGKFHPGATLSYKQTEFDYSNVQLTFHEGTTKVIDGVPCVKIEPDMDLYKEIVEHGLEEVLPNLSTGGLTNPLDVLALRWIDAVQGGEPLFDPGYLLV